MSPDSPPTAEQVKTITAYLLAGGTLQVAAQAAGVPCPVFHRWLRRGRDADADPVYRHFRAAVQQARAQSRLDAEISVRKNKPLDWLRYGPGKGSPCRPAWTAASKALIRSAGSRTNPFLHPSFQAMLQNLLDALAPYPEARAVAAAAVARTKAPA